MILSEKAILDLIQHGEKINVEFKSYNSSESKLGQDIFKTVCAFLNRNGGTIILGVSDRREIIGIKDDLLFSLKKDLTNTLSNSQKISPVSYFEIDIKTVNNKNILLIHVLMSSQVHRCNNRIYDRKEDGDFDITDNTRLVGDLYARKSSCYSENRIYPYVRSEHLRDDLISQIRKLVKIRREDHPWIKLDDWGLLKSAQLIQTDHTTGETGVTLAGVLIFGKDETILSVIPHHKTDLLVRIRNQDRYDDRDDVRTNLIESYERIVAFIDKHLSDPFYLEGVERISLKSILTRELASNILIHREYTNPFPAKIIIKQNVIEAENSNKPHGYGEIDANIFSPFPKNPIIANFFREIGRADELGSGVRNLTKYYHAIGEKQPIFIEKDVFKTIIDISHLQLVNSVLKEPSLGHKDPSLGHKDPSLGHKDPSLGHKEIVEKVKSSKRATSEEIKKAILILCLDEYKTIEQLSNELQRSKINLRKNYISILLKENKLELSFPDTPNHPNQSYKTKK